jgi:hypothetical protein
VFLRPGATNQGDNLFSLDRTQILRRRSLAGI